MALRHGFESVSVTVLVFFFGIFSIISITHIDCASTTMTLRQSKVKRQVGFEFGDQTEAKMRLDQCLDSLNIPFGGVCDDVLTESEKRRLEGQYTLRGEKIPLEEIVNLRKVTCATKSVCTANKTCSCPTPSFPSNCFPRNRNLDKTCVREFEAFAKFDKSSRSTSTRRSKSRTLSPEEERDKDKPFRSRGSASCRSFQSHILFAALVAFLFVT